MAKSGKLDLTRGDNRLQGHLQDGQLDEPELEMGLKESEHKAANVIDFYDTNRNGTISLREAQAGYSRSAEADQRIKARQAAERGAR